MLDSKALEKAAGLTGTMFDDVLKLSVPRKDLRVTVDGFEIIRSPSSDATSVRRSRNERIRARSLARAPRHPATSCLSRTRSALFSAS